MASSPSSSSTEPSKEIHLRGKVVKLHLRSSRIFENKAVEVEKLIVHVKVTAAIWTADLEDFKGMRVETTVTRWREVIFEPP
ncbi:hypothetical protein BVC80_9009g26 [Macleaya cordata]|uniref:Uncharacterized protein n=1 Tax=Macleaya cordata TaxID=56857 RepID=A0A200QLY2_MACCD|nr:hypothetical protein BVC80_9009g26 [Macleaya cordata]